MLATLRRIIDAVDRAPALDAALAVVVREVKQAIGADVCSVYLTDANRREHVLMATDGLPPDSVGRVRISLHRGLIGRAAERADIVNLDDAHTHACYLAITDSGEEPFHGFLGVPIIQHRRVLGVLVLRRRMARRFEDDEVTFVVTLAVQLAAAIALARGSGELARLQQPGLPSHFLEGIAAAPGVGMGTGFVVYAPADLDAVPDKPAADPEAEVRDFRGAVAGVAEDIARLAERMGGTLRDEDQALFDAWRLMLESESFVADTIQRIRAGSWAQGALRATVADLLAEFDRVDDPYLRERGADVRDLGRQVLLRLQHGAAPQADYPAQTVLVGDEVSAMEIAAVPRASLAGIVSRRGSASSHVAILARGMGVPAAVGVLELPVSRLEGCSMIVDGYRGRVYVEPSPTVAAEYRRLAAEERAFSAELEALRGLPSETTDGFALPLYLNTGLVVEQRPLGIDESAGVGLYRTELPFMVRDRFPGEETQRRHYRQVLATFAPRPVTIRTLDVGGDKPLPYFPVHESNPFLGWRGIRITRDHPEIFMTQVRAMLRAAVGLDNLQILLPMITSVDELDDALDSIQRACDELQEEGHAVRLPPVGVMIEVPAAVYQADVLARRVSFLSVGTNDLTQYLLAVDRNNARVAALYDELHPAVLRALTQVTDAARAHGREVTVCGELAGDPRATPLLLGLGVHSLSMGAGSLLRVKGVVRSISRTRARELLGRALLCERGACVRALLMDALEEIGLGGLVRPGR
ncbi:phosphoenolpyruvate--protein phosphotransferase [Thiohalocapsa halophila]|uniref:phosphoenolpyruvate--protein phosphotransferase n=1 Tax=Thiohalocapsa halophila TaxID=69359 RepID=A0ABS1CNE5_9GAMM|nr:phosphoenolpyruvate--protein phosphotransferase [Thiohalocapsa halophila]MBK1633024.1 phosphoenolpyruvate--protein phosphotransferase [Thiohalocapsa halophila]